MLKNRPELTNVWIEEKVTLLSNMMMQIDGEVLVVPRGYKTDLVTVPNTFDFYFNRRYKGNLFIYAAILHDYILEKGYRTVLLDGSIKHIPTSRHAGDYYFLAALLSLGIRKPLAYSMYCAVWIYSEVYLQSKRFKLIR